MLFSNFGSAARGAAVELGRGAAKNAPHSFVWERLAQGPEDKVVEISHVHLLARGPL